MAPVADYWNQNVHYQPVILNAVPPGCGAAIDVGCGDGLLACKLAARCAAVTGIDKDAPMIAKRTLPGVRYHRHLLWRYSLIWDKPA